MNSTAFETKINIDKEKSVFSVDRSFAAPLTRVWKAWTDATLLDQWWAPKPYRTVTSRRDFRPGGMWLYSMKGPEGDQHFCRADFMEIDEEKYFTLRDAFCDENGNPNDIHPGSEWKVSFKENDGVTHVHIDIHYARPEDLEKIMEMGMKEGFSMALENLHELLS